MLEMKLKQYQNCQIILLKDNLKPTVDPLDVGTLKAVPVDLKELNDLAVNKVVKNTNFNTLKIIQKNNS